MITGYITVAFVLIILSTSFFRNYMPYKVFYGIHHLVFAMYLVVLLHTIDINVRKDGQNRSQTFKWFSATLLYYVSDRLAMRLNHRYKTRVLQAKIVKNTKSSMILLQLRRPSLFQYEPGQYAHLRFPDIDSYWHPFSIGSSPDSNVLEFYVEVYDDKSWTGKLCQLLGNDVSHENVRVQVMGPYGTRLGDTHRYSHAMAIGSGSGVVPILGLYKKHICQLLRLDPQTYFEEQAQMHSQLKRMERAREQTRGSWLNYFLRCSPQPTRHEMGIISGIFDSSDAEAKDLREAAKRASLPIYGVNILMQLVVLGVIMLGLTLSWNTMPFELYDGMREVLIVGSIVFQGAFVVVSIGYWDRGSLLAYVDVLIVIAGAVANWYWFEYDKWANFEAAEHVYYILLFGYLTARLWHSAVKPRYCSLRSSLERQHTCSALDKLHFVWITRPSTNVLKIAPTIMQEWNALVAVWGLENAVKVCQVSIYVTDKDKAAVDYLKQELSDAPLQARCIPL